MIQRKRQRFNFNYNEKLDIIELSVKDSVDKTKIKFVKTISLKENNIMKILNTIRLKSPDSIKIELYKNGADGKYILSFIILKRYFLNKVNNTLIEKLPIRLNNFDYIFSN